MSTITVTGHSDDTISISGDLSDEFNHYDNGPAYLTFDDGTVLSAHYTNGIWGFMPERSGSSTVHVDLPVKPDGYTETATITGPITRVRYTTDRAEAMPRTPFEDLDSLLNVLDDERLEAGDDAVADRLPGGENGRPDPVPACGRHRGDPQRLPGPARGCRHQSGPGGCPGGPDAPGPGRRAGWQLSAPAGGSPDRPRGGFAPSDLHRASRLGSRRRDSRRPAQGRGQHEAARRPTKTTFHLRKETR